MFDKTVDDESRRSFTYILWEWRSEFNVGRSMGANILKSVVGHKVCMHFGQYHRWNINIIDGTDLHK
jgi:hypothetical protein